MNEELYNKIKERSRKLLQIDDKSNKLINLYNDSSDNDIINIKLDSLDYLGFFSAIKSRIGLEGSIYLKDSGEIENANPIIFNTEMVLDWESSTFGVKYPEGRANSILKKLKRHSDEMIRHRGVNPLFLSIGAIKWQALIEAEKFHELSQTTLVSPLLIFPIKLVRSGERNQLFHIEFIDDDIMINPAFLCLYEMQKGKDKSFPVFDNSQYVDLHTFDIKKYFDSIEEYIENIADGEISITFEKNNVSIAKYNSSDLAIYNDIEENMNKICNNEILNAIFIPNNEIKIEDSDLSNVDNLDYSKLTSVLNYDASQYRQIELSRTGKSFYIQGPPGSGKTQTIINLIVDKIASNQKVLFVSSKAAALNEVYLKTPKKLRRYMLLLDNTSEENRINVNNIYKDLQASYSNRNYESDVNEVISRRKGTTDDLNSHQVKLNNYVRRLFDNNNSLGYSLYVLYGQIAQLEQRLYLESFELDDILSVDHWEFENMYEAIERIGNIYQEIDSFTNGDITNHPYYSLKNEFQNENNYQKAKNIGLSIENKITKALNSFSRSCDIVQRLSINILKDYNEIDVSDEFLSFAFSVSNEKEVLKFFEKVKSEFSKAFDVYKKVVNYTSESVFDKLLLLDKLPNKLYSSVDLTKDNVNDIIDMIELANTIIESEYSGSSVVFDSLYQQISTYKESRKEIKEKRKYILEHFNEDIFNISALDAKEYKKIYHKAISDGKISFLEGKAKKIDALLRELCSGVYYYEIADNVLSCLVDVIELKEKLKNNLFITKYHFDDYSDESITLFFLIIQELYKHKEKYYSDVIEEYKNYFTLCKEVYQKLQVSFNEYLDLNDLIDDYNLCSTYIKYYKDKSLHFVINGLNEFVFDNDFEKVLYNLEELFSIRDITNGVINATSGKHTTADKKALFMEFVSLLTDEATGSELLACVDDYNKFYQSNIFASSKVFDETKSIHDLLLWAKNIQESDVYGSYVEFSTITRKCSHEVVVFCEDYLSLSRDEYPYEDMVDCFKYNFYFRYIEEFSKSIEFDKYKLNRVSIDSLIEEFSSDDQDLYKYNVNYINNKVLEHIINYNNNSNYKLSFLGNTLTYNSARALFKNRAEEILTLKPCLMMSPNMVAQLLQNDLYREFDCVIFDEASQVPSSKAIAVLYRGRQVIIVGDQEQMPVIELFTGRSAMFNQAHNLEMRNVFSILDEIAQVSNLKLSTLDCNYRSKSEDLIRFSNYQFYSNRLITFPSPILSNPNLGLVDEFVEGGYFENGINKEEITRIVDLIISHFQNEKSRDNSLGVITFNQKQAETIINDLNKKCRREGYDFIPNLSDEKRFFIYPIDKVQGHEMDVIILSLMYGKSKNPRTGVITSSNVFGQLNQVNAEDRKGLCLFNVAITRAKSALILVHSIKKDEITSDGLKYISEFLEIVEQCAKSAIERLHRNEEAETPFIKSVADYVYSLVEDKSRVVFGFGSLPMSYNIHIAILSADKTKAILGIRCEDYVKNGFSIKDTYINFNYILEQRGWDIYNVYCGPWVEEQTQEKRLLKNKILNVL